MDRNSSKSGNKILIGMILGFILGLILNFFVKNPFIKT